MLLVGLVDWVGQALLILTVAMVQHLHLGRVVVAGEWVLETLLPQLAMARVAAEELEAAQVLQVLLVLLSLKNITITKVN